MDGPMVQSRQQASIANKTSPCGALSFMSTPSPDKKRVVLPINDTFVSSFERYHGNSGRGGPLKKNEIILRQAAAVRREKKNKLNSLYFKS
jgi:hypothetical protein